MKPCKHLFISLLSLVLIISGCTTLDEQQPVETEASFIDRQITLARQQEKNQELAMALNHWQVILLINPAHAQAVQQRKILEATLSERAKTTFSLGMRAFRSGNHKAAKKQFLATLAAEPSNMDAINKLREIQTSNMMRAQQRKMSRERQNSGQRNLANKERPQQPPTRALLSSPGGQLSETRALEALLENKQYQALINRASTVTNAQNHDTVKLLLAQAHSAIATDYLSKNQLEQASLQFYKASALVINNTKLAELNNKLATAYHQNGRRLLSTDIDKGIVYLQESLKHDASNKQVENLLRQSQLMKKRLSEIDAGR